MMTTQTGILLALFGTATFAVPAAERSDAVGRWLTEKTMQAAREGRPIALLKEEADPAPSDELITVDSLDAPEEVKAELKARFERAARGVVAVPAGSIATQAMLLDQIPRTVHSGRALRQRLPAPPAELRHTLLATARLLGMAPSGDRDGPRSGGLTRYFQLADAGIVAFNEVHRSATGSSRKRFAEADNTAVAGQPAFLQLSADPQGNSRVQLQWDRGAKTYELVAVGDRRHDVHHMARVLQAIAATIM